MPEMSMPSKNKFYSFINTVTSLISPSGCGKTTLLRCFNRMHDLYPNNQYEEYFFKMRISLKKT
jgi:ABC-type phosphate transport system ATPase subunit